MFAVRDKVRMLTEVPGTDLHPTVGTFAPTVETFATPNSFAT